MHNSERPSGEESGAFFGIRTKEKSEKVLKPVWNVIHVQSIELLFNAVTLLIQHTELKLTVGVRIGGLVDRWVNRAAGILFHKPAGMRIICFVYCSVTSRNNSR